MSKNLEREHRALVNSEVPDLWARIEAGLEEKKAAPQKAETDLHITDFPVTDSQMESKQDKKVNFKVWAGVAAACVCAALILPAMTRTVNMSGGSGSNNTAPQAAEESYEETAYEDMGIGTASADNGMSDNATSVKNTVTSDSADTANAAGEVLEEAADEEQEQYRFYATVEILDRDADTDGGILYMARVIASESPSLQPDSEIRILSPVAETDGMTVLENAQTYDLMLCEEHTDESGQERTYLLVNDAVQ